jgi:hypothetical protein
MGVASLSREVGPFAVCSPSYLNHQHIKMGVVSLSREAGTFLVLALKAARGFPVYRILKVARVRHEPYCDQQDGCLVIARDGDLYCPSFIFFFF